MLYLYFQEMEASENPSLQTGGPDPMLFCTASKKNRFYIFSTRQPDLRYVGMFSMGSLQGGASKESLRGLLTLFPPPPPPRG